MGSFGFGTTDNQTTTNVSNQQVATESGIGIGANSKDVSVSITSSDPATVAAALGSNVKNSGQAFDFGSHALDTVSATTKSALDDVTSAASLSILSGNDLATKFATNVSKSQADNIALLSSLAQSQSDSELRNQKLASNALDASFAVSKGIAPQTEAAQVESATGSISKILYVFFGLGALVAIVFFWRKS